MDKPTFFKAANEYIKNVETDKEFKLKHIIGDDCPAYPGQWLFEAVERKEFDTSSYVVELVGKDYSDTYIKKSVQEN